MCVLRCSMARRVRTGLVALATLHATWFAAPLLAQIRGRTVQQPQYGWWFSGGAAATVLNSIADGATRSRWDFGSDPQWQLRASLEKGLDEVTTVGAAISYGRVDLTIAPLVSGTPVGGPGATTCPTGCDAETDLWTAMGQFRSGGGPGFHTIFEAQGGATAFRNLRVKSTQEAIGTRAMQMDLSGSLGGGFGYTLSRGFAISVVQDFGMGWHAKADLPAGTGRTWRMRSTRATLRFSL